MGSLKYFETVASGWDRMRSQFFSETVRDKALSKAAVREGQRAADIGAGTGFISEALLKRGLKVIAVDQSPEMLGQIQEKFASSGLLDCRLGTAEELPLQDAEVDHVFANMYLHHVESPEKAIQEMARILKPQGTLVITDLDEHNHGFLLTEQHDRWPGFRREDVSRWLREGGLTDVALDCTGQNCCGQSEDGSESAKISIFVASGRKPAVGNGGRSSCPRKGKERS